jgi:hypothetical protein
MNRHEFSLAPDCQGSPDPQRKLSQEHLVEEIETFIIQLWSEILDITVGVHDEFLVLGGNSVQAMQFISRLQAEWGLELPQRVMFEHATPAAIALMMVNQLDRCALILATLAILP